MGNLNSGEGALTDIKVAARNFDSTELMESELLFAQVPSPTVTAVAGKRASSKTHDRNWQIRALSSNERGLDKAAFLSHFPLPDLLGDRLFMVLDFKNDRCTQQNPPTQQEIELCRCRYIDYEEFLCGLAVACRGSARQIDSETAYSPSWRRYGAEGSAVPRNLRPRRGWRGDTVSA